MKTIYITTLLALLTLAITHTACEKIIDMDIPTNEQKLVLNAHLAEDSTILAMLSNSVGILEPYEDLKHIENANIEVFENDISVGIMNWEQNLSIYKLPNFSPKTGNTYSLKAISGNKQPAEGSTTIPASIEIEKLDTGRTMVSDFDYVYEVMQFSTQFTDPATEKNYYEISLTMETHYRYFDGTTDTTYIDRYPAYITSEDPVIENANDYSNQSLVFSDNMINGRTYNLKINMDNYFYGDSVKIIVNLASISEDLYLYKKSYAGYQSSLDNPFAEPNQVYSNVVGGYGVVGSYSVSQDAVWIKSNYNDDYYYKKDQKQQKK